jgi:arylsulfatase A-like enzyme
MSGKWNVGYGRAQWPVKRGFDHYFGLLRGASNYFAPLEGPRRKTAQFALDGEPFAAFDDKFYLTDAITERAIDWLDEIPKASPFFLYLAYTAPHSPLHAWPDDIAKYRDKYGEGWDVLRVRRHQQLVAEGILEPRWQLSSRDPAVPAWPAASDKSAHELKMAVYAAQVDRLDQQVGKVLAKIKELGREENTLVLFLSDNGADAGEEDGIATKDIPPGPKESCHIYGRPWAGVSNTPLRGYKRQMYEGGIASPLIAWWPAEIKSGRISGELSHIMDLMATCLDVAGAAYPEKHRDQAVLPLEGKSLRPVFQSHQRPGHDVLCWEHEGHRAVRQGNWKLVATHRGPWEAYDLSMDRTEQNNLAAVYPDKVRELALLYDSWSRRCGVVPWSELQATASAKQN